MTPIIGKVALVMGPRELVINKGARDGVWTGMKFAVLDLRASDITDPETDAPLGSLRLEKIRVEVVRVEPQISLASTYELVSSGGIAFTNLQQLLAGPGPKYETFIGELSSFDERKSIVRRGDTVEQIIELIPHRVIDVVPVFESPELRAPAVGVKAVVLEAVEGSDKTRRYYPIAPYRDYSPGTVVSWEWNMNNVYGRMWYMGAKGEPVKAWDKSAEFAGNKLSNYWPDT